MSSARVVVLGSGFAGLEAAFGLRSLRGDDRGQLTVVSERDDFLFKPDMIYLPFGAAEKRLHVPLAKPLARRLITHRIATVEGIDPDRGVVHTGRGLPLHYEYLVIATGANAHPGEVTGLAEHAHQIWTPGHLHRLGEALQRVVQHAAHGRPQRVLFLVPPGNAHAGPLYELAFMLDTWLRRRDLRHQVGIGFTTHENSYLQPLGPRLHALVATEFAGRDIHGRTGAVVSNVAEQRVTYADGTEREFDLLVAIPPHVAAVTYEGLPADDRGFLTCDASSRAVVGHPEIFAPGDAGDFPVKTAFLTLTQADAVADRIAADIRGTTPEAGFQPVSTNVLEMFDNAAFARVPLTETGDPAYPVADSCPVGTGRIWRLAKPFLRRYLTARFRAGVPFHTGGFRPAVELGLRAGARLARWAP